MEIFTKGLDISAGVISIYLIRYKFKQSASTSEIIKTLIKDIEEKDKKIARLEMEVKTWRHHHERLTNGNENN